MQTRRFELTGDHFTLLSALTFQQTVRNSDDQYPYIDCWAPYGTKRVIQDISRVLQINDGHKCITMHNGLTDALNIILQFREFVPGVYEFSEGRWHRVYAASTVRSVVTMDIRTVADHAREHGGFWIIQSIQNDKSQPIIMQIVAVDDKIAVLIEGEPKAITDVFTVYLKAGINLVSAVPIRLDGIPA